MKQPSPLASTFGGRAGFTVTVGCAGFVIYLWLTGQVTWVPAAIAAAVMAGASNAYREVQAYKAWQREWNVLAGTPEVKRKQHWGVALWLLLLAAVIGQPVADPTFKTVTCWAFVLMSLALLITFFWKLARRFYGARARSASKPRPHHVVQVCLPVARSSPSLAQVTASLPGYCRQLLRHGSKE